MAEFLCTLCGKIFSRKDSFQQHLSIHKQEPCECSDCGKLFKNKIQLSNHIPSHKRITCVGCNISIPLNTKRYHDCAKGTETWEDRLSKKRQMKIWNILLLYTHFYWVVNDLYRPSFWPPEFNSVGRGHGLKSFIISSFSLIKIFRNRQVLNYSNLIGWL